MAKSKKDVRFEIEHFHATYLAAGDEVLSPESTKYATGLAAAKAAKSISEPIPDWADEACHMNREIVEAERETFSRTGNPMCAFRAYVETRLVGDPLPEWVIRYLDQGIRNFWNSFVGFRSGGFPDGSPAPNNPDEAIAEAFGIKPYGNKKTGRGTVWSKYADSRWFYVGRDILNFLDKQNALGRRVKETAAVFEAAQKHDIEPKTAERDWRQFKETYPVEVSFVVRRQTLDKK